MPELIDNDFRPSWRVWSGFIKIYLTHKLLINTLLLLKCTSSLQLAASSRRKINKGQCKSSTVSVYRYLKVIFQCLGFKVEFHSTLVYSLNLPDTSVGC